MDYETPAREKRPSLWSYLLVGLVGAVIGGFLVVGITPQILFHRAGNLQLVLLQAIRGLWLEPRHLHNATDLEDPYAAIMLVAQQVSPAVVGITNQATMGYDFRSRVPARYRRNRCDNLL